MGTRFDIAQLDSKIAYARTYIGDSDGSVDVTTGLQAALDSGLEGICIDQDYKISSVTIPSTVKYIFGWGKIIQTATGNKSFVGSSLSQKLEITGVEFVGAAINIIHQLQDKSTAIS